MHNSLTSTPINPLKRSDYILILIVGLLVALGIAALQPVPGYMDADYYYAGGMQLASGHGFSDPFLWNYLSQPQELPYPSNSYWNPLASIIAAGGMAITGKINFSSARIGFILMAVLAPLVIAALAYRFTQRRSLALVAGFLAIFSGYYLPFIVTTDNYSLYMLVGGLYFLTLNRLTLPKSLLLGILVGAFNLARVDGLLWLPLTLLAVTVPAYRHMRMKKFLPRILFTILNGLLVLAGYLLVMGGWYLRNLAVFGSLMSPGSGYVLWMTNYNQLFSLTPTIYTFQSWLASGLQGAIQVRLSAIWQNLGTAFFAEGMIFLTPLIIAGAWENRRTWGVQIGFLGWLIMLLAESLLFPFASKQGGFFHAGTAFQPLWFALVPSGLEVLLLRQTWKNNLVKGISRLSPVLLLVIMFFFSSMLVQLRVVESGWNEGEYLYQRVDQFLVTNGAPAEAIVIVRNPPAYFIMTNRPAIVIPFGNEQILLAAAKKYHAGYVILEKKGITSSLLDLYNHPENYPGFSTLGVVGDTHILFIKSTP